MMQKITTLLKEKGMMFLAQKVLWKLFELSKHTFRQIIYSILPSYKTYKCNFEHLNWNVFSSIRRYKHMQNEKILFNICDRILQNRFDILGHYDLDCSKNHTEIGFSNINEYLEHHITVTNVKYSKQIASLLLPDHIWLDWQKDFSSGFIWNSREYSRNLKYGHLDGVDIKYPWELGRLQFMPWLAMASIYSRDLKYINKADNILLDFIATNPPYFGVQWMTTMDVAIRAVNICLYLVLRRYLINEPLNTDDIFSNSLHCHLDFIYRNLEWSGGMRANHYFTGICGLLIMCSFLGINDERLKIFRFAIGELANEIMYQFNEDGSNFEASLPYHFFVSNMLFTALDSIHSLPDKDLKYVSENLPKSTKFNVRKNIFFTHNIEKRISAIVDFNYNVPTISGKIPSIGDDDSGFFLRVAPPFSLDNLQIAKRLDFNFNYHYPQSRRDLLKFPDFGLYIFNKQLYSIYFRCGSLGQKGKGGHAHNDQLSFCLYVKDYDVIVDPGSFNYTGYPEMRNKFRSTAYHNVMQINGREQNPLPLGKSGDLFWLRERTFGKIEEINEDKITASHRGFEQRTYRYMEFKQSQIYCTDSIASIEEKYVHFHLHPKVLIKDMAPNKAMFKIYDIEIQLSTDDGALSQEIYEFAPEYGKKVNSNKIVLKSFKSSINWQININETY